MILETCRDLLGLAARQLEVSHPSRDVPDLLHSQKAYPAAGEGGHALWQAEEIQAADDGQCKAAANGALHQHLATCAASVGNPQNGHRAGQRSRIPTQLFALDG